MPAIYTAVAISTGEGRNGHVATTDGTLDLDLSTPGGNGTGTNPEQLFAAGWSACFHSALKGVARSEKVDVSESAVVAEISLNDNGPGDFALSAVLRVELPGHDQATAQRLAEAAHAMCPYSKATRGTIAVELEVTTD